MSKHLIKSQFNLIIRCRSLRMQKISINSLIKGSPFPTERRAFVFVRSIVWEELWSWLPTIKFHWNQQTKAVSPTSTTAGFAPFPLWKPKNENITISKIHHRCKEISWSITIPAAYERRRKRRIGWRQPVVIFSNFSLLPKCHTFSKLPLEVWIFAKMSHMC